MKLLQRINEWRPSLRSRIAAAMLALVTITAVLVAVLAHFAGERLEENVNYDLLHEELSHFERRLRIDPGAEPLRSAALQVYRSSDLSDMPRDIARLKPGIYRSIRRDGRALRVLVRDGEFGRLYAIYDVSDHETAQRIALVVLIAGVLGTLAFTAWAAFRFSRRLVDPIHRFAERLTQIDPSQRHMRLAEDFSGDELAPIARSIDAFLERLDGFVEREQAFTSSASHELRTPLAVIQGAVELLSAQANEAQTAPLARIQRALREMSEFTTALLSLAREPEVKSNDASCDIAPLLARLSADLMALDPGKEFVIDHSESTVVAAPEPMATIVVGNLLRNAMRHGSGAAVQCALRDRTLVIRNAGSIPAGSLPRIFTPGYTTGGGYGMGLYIAHRICERYGWHLEITSNADEIQASVRFTTKEAGEQSPASS